MTKRDRARDRAELRMVLWWLTGIGLWTSAAALGALTLTLAVLVPSPDQGWPISPVALITALPTGGLGLAAAVWSAVAIRRHRRGDQGRS